MTHDEFQKKVMKLARRECSPSEAGVIALELIAEAKRLRIAAGESDPATPREQILRSAQNDNGVAQDDNGVARDDKNGGGD